MGFLVTIKSKEVVIDKENTRILTALSNIGVGMLSSSDPKIKKGFLVPRVKQALENIWGPLGALEKTLKDFKDIYLDPPADELRSAYVEYLNDIAVQDGLSPAELEEGEIRSPLVLIREILIRLATLALCTDNHNKDHDGDVIIKILCDFISKVSEDECLWVRKLQLPNPMKKKLTYLGKALSSSLDSSPLCHQEWLSMLSKMVSAIKLLHANSAAMSDTLGYLKKVKLHIMRHLIVEFDRDIDRGSLADDFVRKNLRTLEEKIVERSKALQDSQRGLVRIEGTERQDLIVANIKDKALSTLDTKCRKSEKVKNLYEILNKTELLLSMVGNLAVLNSFTGWVFIVSGALNIENLVNYIRIHYVEVIEKTKISGDSVVFKNQGLYQEMAKNKALIQGNYYEGLVDEAVKRLLVLDKPEVIERLGQFMHAQLTTLLEVESKLEVTVLNPRSLKTITGQNNVQTPLLLSGQNSLRTSKKMLGDAGKNMTDCKEDNVIDSETPEDIICRLCNKLLDYDGPVVRCEYVSKESEDDRYFHQKCLESHFKNCANDKNIVTLGNRQVKKDVMLPVNDREKRLLHQLLVANAKRQPQMSFRLASDELTDVVKTIVKIYEVIQRLHNNASSLVSIDWLKRYKSALYDVMVDNDGNLSLQVKNRIYIQERYPFLISSTLRSDPHGVLLKYGTAGLGGAIGVGLNLMFNAPWSGSLGLVMIMSLAIYKQRAFATSIQTAIDLYNEALQYEDPENTTRKLLEAKILLEGEFGKGSSGTYALTRMVRWAATEWNQYAFAHLLLAEVTVKLDASGAYEHYERAFKDAKHTDEGKAIKCMALLGMIKMLSPYAATETRPNIYHQNGPEELNKKICELNNNHKDVVDSYCQTIYETCHFVLAKVIHSRNEILSCLPEVTKFLRFQELFLLKHMKPYGNLCALLFTFTQGMLYLALKIYNVQINYQISEVNRQSVNSAGLADNQISALFLSRQKFEKCLELIDGALVEEVNSDRLKIFVNDMIDFIIRSFERQAEEYIFVDFKKIKETIDGFKTVQKRLHALVEETESVRKTVLKQSPLGLKHQPVPQDGHCLFHAVALHCGQDQQALRNVVVANIEYNMEKYRDIIQTLNPEKAPEQYLQDVRQGIEWADNLEIVVLMTILNQPIVVVETDGKIRNLSSLIGDGVPIFVEYNGHNHYDALILTGEKDAREIFEALKLERIGSQQLLLDEVADDRQTRKFKRG